MGVTAKTHAVWYDITVAGVSDVITTARFRNKRGIHFSRWVQRNGRFDLYLEGRPSPDAPWTTLLHTDEGTHSQNPRTFASAVYHMPELRYRWTIAAGSPKLQVWYIE